MTTGATGPKELGRDFDAYIAFETWPGQLMEIATQHYSRAQAALLTSEFGKVDEGDPIARVRVWTKLEDSSKPTWQLAQKTAKFPERIPLSNLLSGREGEILEVECFDKVAKDYRTYKFLCVQKATGSEIAFQEWPLTQTQVRTYPPQPTPYMAENDFGGVVKEFDPALHISRLREAQTQKITVPPPLVRQEPNADETFSRRMVSLFKVFQAQQAAGQTGFKLYVSDRNKSEAIDAHPQLLIDNSTKFKTLFESKTNRENPTSEGAPLSCKNIDALKKWIQFLYTNTIDATTLADCRELVLLHFELGINRENSHLFEHCLKTIESQITEKDIWYFICCASTFKFPELLDIATEYLKKNNLNLLNFVNFKAVSDHIEAQWDNLPLRAFLCDQLRGQLIATADAKLWYSLFQFTQECPKDECWKVGSNDPVKQLRNACIDLAHQIPELTQEYQKAHTREVLKGKTMEGLKAVISLAKLLQCRSVQQCATEILKAKETLGKE